MSLPSSTYEYDSNGQMTKEVVTPKEKGEDVITTTFVYENGKLMSKTEITGKSKVPSDEAKYKYDDRGELIQSAHYRDGKIHSEIDYVYFEYGKYLIR